MVLMSHTSYQFLHLGSLFLHFSKHRQFMGLYIGFKHSANYAILTLEQAYEVPMVPWTVITSWLRIRDKLLEGWHISGVY
jgi:hypothetical protein